MLFMHIYFIINQLLRENYLLQIKSTTTQNHTTRKLQKQIYKTKKWYSKGEDLK